MRLVSPTLSAAGFTLRCWTSPHGSIGQERGSGNVEKANWEISVKESKIMNRVLVRILAVFAATLTVSCAASTLDGVWVDPDYQGGRLDNFLVLGIEGNEGRRRSYEVAVAEKMTKEGVRAIPAYTLLPKGHEVTEETCQPLLRDNNIDAILVTMLLSVDTSSEYVPGYTYVVPNPYYYGLWGYYSRSYAVVSEPGYYTENTTVLWEINLYDASNFKLVWSGVSKTFNPSSAESMIQEVSTLVVDRLKEDGLLAKK